ncbi:LrgB family protein [Oceanivirga miroungae]|uniref:Inner membrane protein YohK n=1 Tax=Oceanivirga miroungae TaxID=1130046 RepID=A0A6I8M628_9FUSO|nr:LrgB family protein [Oceanivirga miroungae]VWL84801.1 Inner membrane protein YohK [Oceanivirga miroungae]
MQSNIATDPFFGIVLTIIIFSIAKNIRGKINFALFNPLLTSVIAIIIILKVLRIEYSTYYIGGSILNALIGPATVALAIPLYKNFDLLIKNYVSILAGIIIGNTINILNIIFLTKALSYSTEMTISFLPKAITTAIAVGVTKSLGGILPITVVLVILTGISGAIFGPFILKLLRVDDEVSIGVALGSSSHAIGTSRAIEYSERAGAIAGLSIVITGVFVIFIAPIAIRFLV